ncbi:hypothetical protein O6H91_18G054300 [Diphasiastrum complanatum]|uniref:Uncharacterized protein n=1 Tax=Diphasiastrum complanatum TaxID=34168 RepID=A0ACC2B1C0_DIPCM|nr:hypothetical protein O6H91_18G054300 [Diphasiastrum complanatum]
MCLLSSQCGSMLIMPMAESFDRPEEMAVSINAKFLFNVQCCQCISWCSPLELVVQYLLLECFHSFQVLCAYSFLGGVVIVHPLVAQVQISFWEVFILVRG